MKYQLEKEYRFSTTPHSAMHAFPMVSWAPKRTMSLCSGRIWAPSSSILLGRGFINRLTYKAANNFVETEESLPI